MQGTDGAGSATPNPEPVDASVRCPWCSAAAPAGTSRCASCGAALVESTVVTDAGIPGLTDVDPSVIAGEKSARRQLKYTTRSHILGPVLGAVGGGIVGHMIGDALESYATTQARGSTGDVNKMGIMDLLELERAGKTGDEEATPVPSAELADPWVDLPPPSIEDQIAGTDLDPWAIRDNSGDARFDPWATATGSTGSVASGAPGATTSAAGAPSPDPWAFGDGPWSQDPWDRPGEPKDSGPRR